MKILKKAGMALIMASLALVMCFSIAPTNAQAAKWKKMKVSKYADKSYYSNYKKTSKIKLYIKAGTKSTTYTLSKKKMEKDLAKLNKAMKKGLKKNPKVKISYKNGKKSATLKIAKKKGSFTVKNGSKVVFSKKFTYSKWKKNTYLLKNSTKKTTMTLKFFGKQGKSFRLYRGKSVSGKKVIARYGVSMHGKNIVVKSLVPGFTVYKAMYK